MFHQISNRAPGNIVDELDLSEGEDMNIEIDDLILGLDKIDLINLIDRCLYRLESLNVSYDKDERHSLRKNGQHLINIAADSFNK